MQKYRQGVFHAGDALYCYFIKSIGRKKGIWKTGPFFAPMSGGRKGLCRGTQNVTAGSILLAFAHNVNKLHHKIQAERTGTHL